MIYIIKMAEKISNTTGIKKSLWLIIVGVQSVIIIALIVFIVLISSSASNINRAELNWIY